MTNTYALLVPCFNSSTYIKSFIENIEKQTRLFDEIIFYDDASTDNTAEIISVLGYKVLIGKINKGPSYSRNILLKTTKCNWVHFHDPDDYLHPDYLLKKSKICLHNICDVILCNVDWVRVDKIEKSYNYSNNELNNNPLEYTLSNPIGGINGLYLKSKLLEIGGFDERLRIWEDADLHVRLAIAKSRFFVIEQTLSFSVRRENSASSNQQAGWIARLNSLEKYSLLESKPNFLKLIGIEAEKTASNLIIYNDIQKAREALYLSVRCGIKIPSSKNIIWQILKSLLPKSFLIYIRIMQLRIAFK